MSSSTYHSPAELPPWHSTFAAAADVAAATVHARGALDLFTIDLLHGAVDVLTLAGRLDVTLDLAEVESVDRSAAWCIADIGAALSARHGSLTVSNAREGVRAVLGELTVDRRRRR